MINAIVIGGPTASGKSGLAVALAKQCNGVIINGDSMQVYDGLPLLTAQPSPEDLATVPHRLYRALSPDSLCTAARWRDMAQAEIDTAHKNGQMPIVVGGTGFYLKTLLRGISPIPDVPADVRANMAARMHDMGNAAFHAELQDKDPVMAARLHPGNTQRLIRAMEVLTHTGKSLAAWQELPPDGPPDYMKFLFVALLPPRALLYQQCNGRFDHMIAAGALEEVADFAKTYAEAVADAVPLKKALGYPELLSHLQNGTPLADAITEAQKTTRHYAKRQVTWFRHQLVADLVLDNPADTNSVLQRLSAA